MRIEVRDKDSGLVTGVKNLRPVLDYDIDYLQGRVLLAEPLASTADDNLLDSQRADSSGDEAYLVVRYEYTPGFEEHRRAGHRRTGPLLGQRPREVGLTASSSDEGDADSSLNGADVTLRMSADSWFKVQGGQERGPGLQLARTPTTAASVSSSDDADRLRRGERRRVPRRPQRRLRGLHRSAAAAA